MTLLVGAPSITPFNANGFFGYANANVSNTAFEAVESGVATTLWVAIEGFGSNTEVEFGLYERVGSAGATANLIATLSVPSSAGAYPQSTAFSGTVNITAGNFYHLLAIGDVTASDGGLGYTYRVDPTFTTPNGIDALYGVTTMPSTLPTLEHSSNGQMYFWVDGTISSTEDLSVTATLEVKGTPGTPISNRSLNVAVLNASTYAVIASPVAQTSASGVIVRGSLTGVTDGQEVLLAVEDPAESDDLARNRVYRVAVYDANA